MTIIALFALVMFAMGLGIQFIGFVRMVWQTCYGRPITQKAKDEFMGGFLLWIIGFALLGAIS